MGNIELIESNTALATGERLQLIGQAANHHAANATFADYLSRKATNTIRAQRFDLVTFAGYLAAAGVVLDAEQLQTAPRAWQGISWGIVEGFVKWQLREGHAVSSVNRRLSTVKVYAKLAAKAGAIAAQELALIQTVTGYGHKEAKRVDERRETTRIGHKKAEHVSLSDEQVQALKAQPETPQGRRDALLLCLLLDHGLRVGEVALLTVTHIDLKKGMLTGFYRPKVDKEQNHKLSADTLRAVQAWFDSGDAPALGPLLRGSRKGGQLTAAGMSTTSMSERVRTLGLAIGVEGLSAHDCRHYWATRWAGRVDVFRLQEAGGWNSLAMPRRYVERAEVANEGMV
ncbi:MAG: tyrosine-type recombinase/integrase [Caldilineaceae bacterium]|nr:tyrosine-type recombinase/integrase [Caldilineaceae bacterium]